LQTVLSAVAQLPWIHGRGLQVTPTKNNIQRDQISSVKKKERSHNIVYILRLVE